MSDSSTMIAEEKEVEEEDAPEGEITPLEPDELDDTDFSGDGDDLGDDEDEDDDDDDDDDSVVDEGGDGVWSSI